MKRAAAVFLVITAPLFFFLPVGQSARYAALEERARRLEAAQKTWIQENRRLEAGIVILSSRERAAEAAKKLGLEPVGPTNRVRIELPGKGGVGSDG